VNVTVENLAPCRKLVRVEVDAQAVDAAFDQLTKEFQRDARLPGFRSGKAPRPLIEKTYARQIEDEAKRKLISDNYRKAIAEQKIEPVGYPDIEEIQFGRGQALQFAATIETSPEFELPTYTGLTVKRPASAVTDADVERAIGILREQRVSYNDVSRPAQEGDIIVVNYSGTTDGKPLTDIAPTARGLTQQTNFWLQIKAGAFIPGFTEQMTGASSGEKRTVNIEFPADFVAPALSGMKGVYEVEVVQVKERILPELNDEFARSFGAEDTGKLREGVRHDLEAELKFKQKRDVHNQLVKALMDTVSFDLPESVVQHETRSVVYNIVNENQQRGVSKEKIQEQKDQIYGAAASTAKDRVKALYILGKIAEKEKIQVTQQEITQRVMLIAEQNDIKIDKLVKQLKDRNGLAEIQEQILTSKVLDFLELSAQIDETPAAPALEAPAQP
jgi:trigger factor